MSFSRFSSSPRVRRLKLSWQSCFTIHTLRNMALSGKTLKVGGPVLSEPDYDLRESNSQLILSVHAPLCRPSNISVFVEKNVFTFDAYPYFLKVKLPYRINNEIHEERFDQENGTYILILRKKDNIEGENSEDENYSTIENISHFNMTNKADSGKQLYGFANTFSGMFGLFYVSKIFDKPKIILGCEVSVLMIYKAVYSAAKYAIETWEISQKEFSQIINLEDPDNTVEGERSLLRQKEEEKKWSEDHYLADLMENEHIKPLLKYTPRWCLSEIRDLNQEEQEILESIPKIKYLETGLSDNQKNLAEFQMVDILLSYCYNNRTMEGENSVESAWTINKLSCCLSWFEVFRDLRSVLVSFYKRSLTYPLYRNWELTRVIHKDVVSLLKSGSSQVTRCFIELRELFDETENCYVLNTLFIDPFCHFSSTLSEEKLSELADRIDGIEIEKEEVHEDLLILELAAKMTQEEERLSREDGKQMNDITERMSAVNFDDSESTSSSDSEDDVSVSDSSVSHISSGSTSK